MSISRDSGVASYYANGKSGQITFTCELKSDTKKVEALLTSGKNFDNKKNIGGFLFEGINGPYTWTLTDEKEDVGNIKIHYLLGSKVTVQCRGYKV